MHNQAGATSTDTIHRLKSKGAKPEHLIANTYTWLTAASAEIEGRSYGGGVLELEPTEAERLLVPAVLNGAMPLAESDRLARTGRLDQVLEENARTVLQGHIGLIAYGLRNVARYLGENARPPDGSPSQQSTHDLSGWRLMSENQLKAAALARVAELVRNFRRNKSDYLRAAYNETQARTEFITPLLEAFGWDVSNVGGLPLSLREVIQEATVEVGEERLSKRPDYELRLARQRKLFVRRKNQTSELTVMPKPHSKAAATVLRELAHYSPNKFSPSSNVQLQASSA